MIKEIASSGVDISGDYAKTIFLQDVGVVSSCKGTALVGKPAQFSQKSLRSKCYDVMVSSVEM